MVTAAQGPNPPQGLPQPQPVAAGGSPGLQPPQLGLAKHFIVCKAHLLTYMPCSISTKIWPSSQSIGHCVCHHAAEENDAQSPIAATWKDENRTPSSAYPCCRLLPCRVAGAARWARHQSALHPPEKCSSEAQHPHPQTRPASSTRSCCRSPRSWGATPSTSSLLMSPSAHPVPGETSELSLHCVHSLSTGSCSGVK